MASCACEKINKIKFGCQAYLASFDSGKADMDWFELERTELHLIGPDKSPVSPESCGELSLGKGLQSPRRGRCRAWVESPSNFLPLCFVKKDTNCQEGVSRIEGRGQRTEDRSQRTEDRSQRTEDRRQRSEDRGQRAARPPALMSRFDQGKNCRGCSSCCSP